MTSLQCMLIFSAAYACAGWIGYRLGIERGTQMERTKRGIRRG